MGSEPVHHANRRLLRARDVMDRCYADALDIEALAKSAHVSRAHFIRSFRATFGETPHRYLQRRRLERAMSMLRESELSVTEISLEVGFGSLGTFSRTFREVIGVSPSEYRVRTRAAERAGVPSCYVMAWDRPAEGRGSSTFGEARGAERV
jgi:transcriptional regulator GlxA family with amidase domain